MIRRWRPTPFNVVQAVAAGAVVLRLLPGARRPPPLQARPGPLPGTPTVAVIVPARDEERRIGPLLAAVAADPQVHEVVVVDDESSDATAAVARAAGALVVTGRPLPAGWVGKPWALQQGLEAVTSDWVVTLDADVVPQPGFVGALLDAATAGGWDVLTVGPRFVLGGPGEQLLHPAM
ncbi:MAG TPA: glycosyltransferase, partial [Acidimicrobiales bacterium]|nr:glycosyltransferase [Acidimicrobiales bacterium]